MAYNSSSRGSHDLCYIGTHTHIDIPTHRHILMYIIKNISFDTGTLGSNSYAVMDITDCCLYVHGALRSHSQKTAQYHQAPLMSGSQNAMKIEVGVRNSMQTRDDQ